MTTKAEINTSQIRSMQIAIAALEHELEDAEGLYKETLKRWLAEAQRTLRQLGPHTLH
jgi:hypothetical protein